MPPALRQLLALQLTAALLGACGASSSSQATTPEPPPPEGAAFLLRAETEQAVPPLARFGETAAIVITLDGRVLTAGAVPAIFPGPLVGPIVQRQLTPAGWTRIVQGARTSGLLTDGPPIGDLAPGETVLLLQIVADGRMHVVTWSNRAAGCLADPCQGPPGTLAAFQGYVGRLMDLSWLATDVGEEAPYLPESYGVVVGLVPDDQGLPRPPMGWPFGDGFDAFGEPFADGSGFRCGAVTGDDAATFRAALEKATQITPWRDPRDGSLHGLTVRPFLPGDGDPCAGLV